MRFIGRSIVGVASVAVVALSIVPSVAASAGGYTGGPISDRQAVRDTTLVARTKANSAAWRRGLFELGMAS